MAFTICSGFRRLRFFVIESLLWPFGPVNFLNRWISFWGARQFFWSLKHEWTKFDSFETLEGARWSVFKYIETFYNSARIHQTLNYRTPNQFEIDFAAGCAA